MPESGSNKVSVGGQVLFADQHNSNVNEFAFRVFDGHTGSNWLSEERPSVENPLYLTYVFPEDRAYVVTSYELTSGNDASDRDFADWTLEGSNDGENWDVLDTKVDAAGSWNARSQTVSFDLSSNTTAYKMYKVNITKNAGSNLTQLSEISLYATDALPDEDNWVHIVATYDGSTATAYVNGRAIRSSGMSLGTKVDASLVFGGDQAEPLAPEDIRSSPWGGNLFGGALDDIRIYNYALTQTEVLLDYMSVVGGSPECIPGSEPALDFNGDCVIGIYDLLVILDNWMENNFVE